MKGKPPIVALLTDFGLTDAYVGVMKAVILSRRRDTVFVDLSHNCPPQCIETASYLLVSAWPYLPRGTVVVAVVDPGVGSDRRELIARGAGRLLVAPDNGLISMVHRMGMIDGCHRVEQTRLKAVARGRERSATFHGRDVFAVVAADLLRSHRIVGAPVDPVLIPALATPPRSSAVPGDEVEATVVCVDHFGNVITSIHRGDLPEDGAVGRVEIRTRGGKRVVLETVVSFYAEVAPGDDLVYVGSSGFVEIAVRNDSAARRYGIGVGDRVVLRVGAPRGRSARP